MRKPPYRVPNMFNAPDECFAQMCILKVEYDFARKLTTYWHNNKWIEVTDLDMTQMRDQEVELLLYRWAKYCHEGTMHKGPFLSLNMP